MKTREIKVREEFLLQVPPTNAFLEAVNGSSHPVFGNLGFFRTTLSSCMIWNASRCGARTSRRRMWQRGGFLGGNEDA